MHREFLGVSESDALSEAVELMVSEGTDCLIVVRGGDPVGSLGSRDALSALLEEGAVDAPGATVGAAMTPPLPTVEPDEPLVAVTELLVSEGVNHVVVTEGGEAVGVVTGHDALAAGTARGADAREAVPVAPYDDVPRGAEGGGAAEEDPARGDDRSRASVSADGSVSPTQGVCEVCGSLVPSLTNTNGQAVCADCREV